MNGFYRRCAIIATMTAVASLVPSGSVSASAVTAAASEVMSGRWSRVATTGDRPSERSAPLAANLPGQLYVFAGARDDFATGQVTFYNDLHRLDVVRHRWTRLAPAGQLPPARAFAAGASDPGRQQIFMFGGSTFDIPGTQFHPFDDLWAYSAATNRWSRLTSVGAAPSARSGSTMWAVGDRLYLFGGIDATFTTLAELWSYDLRRSTWTLLTPAGMAPPGRHVAQAGTVARFGQLTLYGGEAVDPQFGFVTLADTWQYDLVLNRWREVTPGQQNIDPPRNYGAATVLGRALYLYGGDVSGGTGGCGAPFPQNPTAELWRFDLIGHTWQQLSPRGDPLVQLKRHAAAAVDGRMYVVSGWDFRCDGGAGPGQIWNLDVYSLSP